MLIRFIAHAQLRGVAYRPGDTLDVDPVTARVYADAQQADIVQQPRTAAELPAEPPRSPAPDPPEAPEPPAKKRTAKQPAKKRTAKKRTKRTDDARETR